MNFAGQMKGFVAKIPEQNETQEGSSGKLTGRFGVLSLELLKF